MGIYEDKFVVVKINDADEYLDETEKMNLVYLLKKITDGRKEAGKGVNTYYVCNQDEPYGNNVRGVILSGERKKEKEAAE